MNIFVEIIKFLQSSLEAPPAVYGWYHIVCLLLTAAISVWLVVKFRDCDDKAFRRIVWIVWLVMVVAELYKQLVWSVTVVDNTLVWNYQWYYFPFQLCSTPYFIYPFVAFLKDGKLRNWAIAYTALFSFFGGLVVMLYPGDVFHWTIGINIQTMINHMAQVAIGILCAARYRKALSTRFWLDSLPPFGILFAVATVINVSSYYIFKALEMNDWTNMFFISPFYDTTLPVLSMFNGLPHIFLSLIYLAAFALISFIMLWLHRGVYLLILHIQKAKTPSHEA